jgi:pimeloyl-ACP methyl ester carboxylesterase
MKKTFVQIFIFVVVTLIFTAGEQSVFSKNTPPSKPNSKQLLKREKMSRVKASVDDKIQTLPLLFEENKGQFGKNIKFLSRVKNFNLALDSNEVIYQMPDLNCEVNNEILIERRRRKPCKAFLLKMKIIDANPDAVIEGLNEAVTKTSYSIGSDQTKWLKDIPNYEGVRYQNIYQGINLVFRGTEQKLEYDFHIAQNADANLIRLKFDGAKNFQINANGELIFKFKGIELNHQKPFAYQIINDQKVPVKVGYVLLDKKRIGFKLGDYDHTKELIIDPVVYASYLGGTAGGDVISDIAVDRQGNIYTASDARFIVNEIYTYSDVMISKFDITKPKDQQRLWVNIIGGSLDDVPYGMDVDDSGRVYVTGATYSPNFPLHFAEQTTHPIRSTNSSDYTGFVFQLGWDGEISYSTYLGGNTPSEYGESIVADSNANAYVTGFTCSSNFPTRNGFQNSLQGSCNAFLTKYDNFGHITYSTLFGGTNSIGVDVFTEGNGIAYISGGTNNGIYTTNGAYSTTGSGFVAKFDTNKTYSNSLVYSTRIPKQGAAIAVDRSGNAWIAMSSLGFLTTQSAQVIRLNNAGSGLLVGSQTFGNQIRDIAVDGNGSAYFSYNFYFNNNIATKVTALRPSGEIIDSYTVDATRDEQVYGITLGPEPDMVYIGGYTTSQNFPATSDAYQSTNHSPSIFFGQGFFAKIQLNIAVEHEPLIFVPGVSGSWLDEIQSDGTQRNLWIGLLQNHYRLTLDPSQPQANIIATDAIRTILIPIPIPLTNPQQYYYYQKDAYRQILEKLVVDEHYVEYQVNGQPSRRTFSGCDVSGQIANKPNLFVFAYDWRKSNIENADALKDYVGCIRRFHPESKINILAHSMGGLIARRYIITNPNNHHIDKMVTIGAPWLGAPKAINVLETGDFGLSPVVLNSTIRRLGEFFKGMHELLPSRTYFDAATRSDFHLANYGNPFKEEGWDINGNGIDVEDYNYEQLVNLLNQQNLRSNPGDTNQLFHDTIGQDNWLNDTSEVKYFHIYGQQSYLNTPIQEIAKYRLKCHQAGCQRENYYEVIYGRGDQTVPTISAERSFGPYYNLLPRNDKPFFSPNRSQDYSVEHTNLTQNPSVQQEVINFLNVESQQLTISDNQSLKTKSANLTESLQEPGAESVEVPLREGYYVNISGVNYVEIKDDLGNINTPLDGGYILPVPSVNYDLTGEKSIAITTPTEGSYTLAFRSSNETIFLEAIKGMGSLAPTEVVRYLDLNLPANVNAQFQVSSTGIADLRYDSDGNGTFETSVLPTSHTVGNAAKDLTPPTIQVSEIVRPSRQLIVNASDTNSGIRKIYYSLDGTNFQEYFSPIPLIRSQSGTIYTFADDNSANRSLISTYTFSPVPDPLVTITAPASGTVYPVGTTVNFTGNFSGDNCSSHTAVWNFDSISQTGTIDESNKMVTANYAFTLAGVYLIRLTINNNCSGTGSTDTVEGLRAMVVIYEPDGGFVTGGGWFDSPLGAYTLNPNLTGRTSFGFNSKYQRGANVPTGNTEFQFRVADFNFKSTTYDWLVVAGAKAQYKGSGTINGNGNYGFMLTAIDGQINGGGGQDKFRIKIWDKTTNVVIYDNQNGSSDNDNPTTVIGGGSIIIHRQ